MIRHVVAVEDGFPRPTGSPDRDRATWLGRCVALGLDRPERLGWLWREVQQGRSPPRIVPTPTLREGPHAAGCDCCACLGRVGVGLAGVRP